MQPTFLTHKWGFLLLSLAVLFLMAWNDSFAADLPVVSVATSDPVASEAGPGAGVFVISRTGSTDSELTVIWSLSGTAKSGVDYIAIPIGASIPRGRTQMTVIVTPIDDILMEENETVILTLQPRSDYRLGTVTNATITILNNDEPLTAIPAKITISNLSNGDEVRKDTTNIITAILDDPSRTIDSVRFYANQGLVGTVTAAPYSVNWVIGPVPGRVALTAVATGKFGAVTSPPVWVEIVQVLGLPILTIALDGPSTVNETSTAPVTVTFTRTGATNVPLRAGFAIGGTAQNGQDYAYLFNSISFAPGESQVKLPILPIADTGREVDETISLTLTPNVAYRIGTSSNVVITIHDPDPLGTIRITNPANGSVFYTDNEIPLRVETNLSPAGIQKIEYFRSGQSLGALTSPPYSLTLSNPAAGSYSIFANLTDSRGLVVRSAPVVFTVNAVQKPSAHLYVQGATNIVENSTNSIPVWVNRTGSTAKPLTLFYSISGTASNGVDYVKLPGSFEIPAGVSMTNFFITPIVDDIVEPDETVTLKLLTNSAYIVDFPEGSVNVVIKEAQTGVALQLAALVTTATSPAQIPLTVSASINNATVVEYRFITDTGQLLATRKPPTNYFVWNVSQAGTYNVRAEVADSFGRIFKTPYTPITILPPLAAPAVNSASSLATSINLKSGVGGGATLSISGPEGASVDVEMSEDLVHWKSQGSVTVINNGHAVFTDESATAAASRFYRVAVKTSAE